jgi:hypothetical protein
MFGHRGVSAVAVAFAAVLLGIGGGVGCSDPMETGSGPEPDVARGVAGQFGRIYYSDLTYLGAFKCPDRTSWSWAKGLIAYVPGKNQLIATGRSFAWLDIPAPVISPTKNPADLNEAFSPQGGMFDPMPAVNDLLDPAKSLGGVTWHNGRLWIATWEFYNAAARDNLGLCSFDENFGDPRGAWRVGPSGVDVPVKDMFHANKTHDYIMRIPSDWSNVYTPGHELAAGRHREAGSNGGGRGPSLYAFEANELAPHGSHLNGIPLMSWRENDSNARWPDYRKADNYRCIWVSRGNRHAVIVGAMKGLGPNFYGIGPPCTPDKGFHAHPYEPRMYFMDVNELGEIARGDRLPWDIRAYDEVVPQEMWAYGPGYDPDCKSEWFRDWAWDEERGLLYASQPRGYDIPALQSNRMIIHVWQVN